MPPSTTRPHPTVHAARPLPRPRLLAGLGLALTLGLAAAPAQAGQLAGLRVFDRTSGETLPVYRHGGRLYVAGVPGHAYELSLTNKTGERLLAVISVDGVNALSGETAGTAQRGYVFGPFETDRIKGWRKNLDSVARFTFAALPDSYAARTGRPDNVGVIGVALFRENVPLPVVPGPEQYGSYDDRPPVSTAPAAPSANRSASGSADSAREAAPAPPSPASVAKPEVRSRQRLGTGHGRRIVDRVGTTGFERASDTPDEVLTVYYDSRPTLVARGIIPRVSPPRYARAPEAFPGGFVPDP